MISGALRGIKGTFSLSALLVEVVTSWVALGALLGALAAGELADQIGRKQTGLIAGAMFTLGALVQALAPDTFLLVAGWLIIGAAVGVAAVAAPLYAAELAPTTLRGQFVSAYQLAITIGIFLAYLIDGWLSDRDAWRTMLGVAAVPGLLLFAVALVAPRSPRWLMKMGAAPMRPSTTRSSPTSPLPTSIPHLPCRTRWMDLVYPLGGMDVSGRPRVDPWVPSAGSDTTHRSLHTKNMAGASGSRSVTSPGAMTFRLENPGGVCRGISRAELDDVTLAGDQARIPLADDGGIHHVRVVLG